MKHPTINFQCSDCDSTFGIDLEFIKANTTDELTCPLCNARAFSHITIMGFNND